MNGAEISVAMTTIRATSATDLAALGNVDPGYRHHARLVEPDDPLRLPGAILKWYDLRRTEVPLPDQVKPAARAFLRAEAAAGRLELGNGLGFVVLHVSDARSYLIVGAWRDNQELWETLFVRDHAGEGAFMRRQSGVDAPTLCVWELAPVWHEREAWVRYLHARRDEAAKRAYLGDHLAGLV